MMTEVYYHHHYHHRWIAGIGDKIGAIRSADRLKGKTMEPNGPRSAGLFCVRLIGEGCQDRPASFA